MKWAALAVLTVGCTDHTNGGRRYTAVWCYSGEPCGDIDGLDVGCFNGTCIDESLNLCEATSESTCPEKRPRSSPANTSGEFSTCPTFHGTCAMGDLCHPNQERCLSSWACSDGEFIPDEVCPGVPNPFEQ